MIQLVSSVDRLLRGEFSRKEDLREGRITAPTQVLAVASLALGVIYGACMGFYALYYPGGPGVAQTISSAIKVPLLFLLTLGVTFPSLYVFSALSGSRLRFRETLRLLLMTIGICLAVLASLGPVTMFFTLSTKSYGFMKLLNVFFFAVAGLVSLAFLHRASDEIFADPEELKVSTMEPARKVRRVLFVWLLIYSVVGAQMGWILRPFIGAPTLDFVPFRGTQSNFFADVFETLHWTFH